MDGGTRQPNIEMLGLMNAGRWSSPESQCVLYRVAPPFAILVLPYAREVGKASIPGAKLSLPILIDVMSSKELYLCGDGYKVSVRS